MGFLFSFTSAQSKVKKFPSAVKQKMPKIDTLDALEEHEEHNDDYQTITN